MSSAFRIQRALHALRQGAIIACPTEGVWGLGCDPFNADAVLALLALKQRPLHKGLILVAASTGQLAPFLAGLTNKQRDTLNASWPGPNTWLVPANDCVPPWISGGQSTVALRVSAHPLLQQLCAQFSGPIVSTSANISGRPAAKSLLQVQLQFAAPDRRLPGGRVVLVPGALGADGKPTTIRNLVTGNVIRS